MKPQFSEIALLSLCIAIFIGMVGDVQAQDKVRSGKAKNTIRTAMLAPRGSLIYRSFREIDYDMRAATANQWGVRIYASGVAGDEKDVIRKMRVGQMDSAIVTTTGMSQVVKELAILNTPGIIHGYDDIKKVKNAMWDEWKERFLKNNIKLITWYPAGEYRLFSKGSIKSIPDIKKHRPWLWPESFTLKELWRAVGATGVPLGVPDVYGALQTGMIDTFINTCVATVAMQWHTKVDHMTDKPRGVLLLAWVMNKNTWNNLPSKAREVIEGTVKRLSLRAYSDAQKADRAAMKKLLKRGYVMTKQPKGFDKVDAMIRKRLTGRIFSQALVDRIRKITGR